MTNLEIDELVAKHIRGWTLLEGAEDIIKAGHASYSHVEQHYLKVWQDKDGQRMACLECGTFPSVTGDAEESRRLRRDMRGLGWNTRIESTPDCRCTSSVWKNGQVFTKRGPSEEISFALACLAAFGVEVPAE